MLKYLEALLLAALAVFAPVQAVMLATLALVFVDTATGVYAAWKRKEPITSTGFKRTVGKVVLYETAICMGFLCEHYFTGDLVPVCKMISAMIGLVECKSILENLDSISGTNTFQAILNKITQAQDKK